MTRADQFLEPKPGQVPTFDFPALILLGARTRGRFDSFRVHTSQLRSGIAGATRVAGARGRASIGA